MSMTSYEPDWDAMTEPRYEDYLEVIESLEDDEDEDEEDEE